MIVLGIHDGHDASACLLRDGKLILGSAEERRRNLKNFAGVPTESIKEIFRRSGIKPSEVDLVAIGCRIRSKAPGKWERQRTYPLFYLKGWLGQFQWSTTLGQWVLSKRSNRAGLFSFLAEQGVKATTITLDHHSTHAACAYYHRP